MGKLLKFGTANKLNLEIIKRPRFFDKAGRLVLN